MSKLLDELGKQSELTLPERVMPSCMEELTVSPEDIMQMWTSESLRRYDAYIRGEIEAHPGDEVMTRTRNLLRRCIALKGGKD